MSCERHPTAKKDRFNRCTGCLDAMKEMQRERVKNLPPCRVCGDRDYSPRGDCRPCAARRKAEQREREAKVKVDEELRAEALELARRKVLVR